MPDEFKKNLVTTDAPDMSDTVLNDTSNSFLLDGDVPRLASPSLPAPGSPVEQSISEHAQLSALPSPSVGTPPVLLALDGPSLPTPGPAVPSAVADQGSNTETTVESTAPPRHPMAHLMPEKSMPSEASRRAAEARAAKKAKARRVKIVAGIVFLAVAALVGPPLGRWLVNAIDEAGKTQTEEPPATTVPAADASTPAASTPAAVDPKHPAGVVGAIEDAKAVVGQTNADTTPVAPATTVAP